MLDDIPEIFGTGIAFLAALSTGRCIEAGGLRNRGAGTGRLSGGMTSSRRARGRLAPIRRASGRALSSLCALACSLSSAPAAGQTLDLFKIWTPQIETAPEAPEPLPLRRPGPAAGADESAAAADDCTAPGMPLILDTLDPVEFVDDGDRILMRYAEWGLTRTVHMGQRDGAPHGGAAPLGESFGRWEGNTLAIFTLYIDYPRFDRHGTPQGPDVSVLERYTPSDDGRRLEWVVTVTDPATFTRPVVRRGRMTDQATGSLDAFRCVPPGA
jgi:hypothetical protein